MIKAGTDDIAKGEKKIKNSKKSSFLGLKHFEDILIFAKGIIHKLILKAFLFSFALVLAILFLEFALRVSEKKHYDLSTCQSLDENFHHVMIPNSTCRFKTEEWDVIYRINSMGFRDEEVAKTKASNEVRILLLGDSFGQGFGVDLDKTFANSLERKLSLAGKKKVDIINASVLGYSPLIEYLYLKEKGLDLRPDMVILEFSLTEFWEDRVRLAELKNSNTGLNEEEISQLIKEGNIKFHFDQINKRTQVFQKEKIALPFVSFNIKQWLRTHSKV